MATPSGDMDADDVGGVGGMSTGAPDNDADDCPICGNDMVGGHCMTCGTGPVIVPAMGSHVMPITHKVNHKHKQMPWNK